MTGGNRKMFQSKLLEIDVEKITPNPDNPRGKHIRDNDDSFLYLKRSIKEFGLLVPLVVHTESDSSSNFKLLDGERRYYALKELGINKAWAHVLIGKYDQEYGKNLMFHVHTNRVQWEPDEQCRALEPLYEKLKKKYRDNEKNIAKDLVLITGTPPRTVTARLLFLRWPRKIKDMVYSKQNDNELFTTIVEIERHIIMPAQDNFPEYFETVPVDEVRQKLLEKYMKHTVHAATEARRMKLIVNTRKAEKEKYRYSYRLFKKVVEDIPYTFSEAANDYSAKFSSGEINDIKTFPAMFSYAKQILGLIKELDSETINTFSKPQRKQIAIVFDRLLDICSALSKATKDVLKS
jgi:ParB/RepB/Spo0J family partition protein